MDRAQEVDALAERRHQDQKWVAIQHKTFTRWCNTFLKERMLKVDDLSTDFQDGVNLIQLLEIISSKPVHAGRWNKKPRIRVQKMENNQFALEFLATERIKVVNVGNNDITDGNLKIILGLVWTIILRYQINLSEGGSARSELLKWVRSKIPSYNITNFSPDWNDGKALCALVDALQPGRCPNHADLDPHRALENAILGENLGEEHFGIPKVLDPEDMISEDLDELSMMTYISYYRDWEGNHAAKEAEARMLRTAIPSSCKAYGPGLEPGVLTNVPTEFTIESINAKGTRVPCGGDEYAVDIIAPSGGKSMPKPTDHDDGTYTVNYTAMEVGEYKVSIMLNGEHISGSVFSVPVARNAPSAGNCKAYGPGLEPGCKVGEPAPFVIEAIGATGVRCSEGGDHFEVRVSGPGDADVKVNVKDNNDGTYAAAYHPIKAGEHKVSVKLNGSEDIEGSVFTVPIDANAGDADAANTVAYGPGVEGPVNTAEPAVFTVETRNAAGEKCTLSNSDAPIDCWIEDPDKNEVDADVVDNGDGTRTVTYQPTVVGPHVVNVVLRNRYSPSVFEHIKDSPFTVDVAQGTFGANCEAFGPGLESGVPKATIETHFTIQGRDRDGEKCTAGGATFDIDIAGPKGPVPSAIEDHDDGTYTVRYTAADPGDHTVSVSLRGDPIKDSPFAVKIKSATDAANSEASGPGLGDRVHDGQPTTFTVQAKDRDGQNIPEGGDPFVAKIAGPSGADVPVALSDNGDGTYTAAYTPTEKGPHTVVVSLEDTPIKNMPVTVDVKSRVCPKFCVAEGPGVEGPLDDTDDGVFTIQAKDFAGNNVTEGGETFVVTVDSPTGPLDCSVSDNGDGTYDCMYQPEDDGQYKIDIQLHNESIKDAPFTLDVGEGVHAGNTRIEAFTFVVQAFSKKGGPKSKGGAIFACNITDKATGERVPDDLTELNIKDRGNGKYRIMYKLPPGEFEIDCTINGRSIAHMPMSQSASA